MLDILQSSLQDCPAVTDTCDIENGMRYKLIIDSSDDESAVRLLFAHEILEKENTRMYVCSEFAEEGHRHVS